MADVATRVRTLGKVARVASKMVGQSRGWNAVAHAGRTTARQFRRILGQLWLEVTGFVFLCLAGIGGIAMVREYMKYHAGGANSGRVALAAGFTVLFGWFGLSSFWRIRKKN